MMRSMFSGIAGIRAHQVKLDVVANNISNVNTVGFKASRVTFKEVLNQTVQPAFGAVGTDLGGVNAQQIGLGVAVGTIDVLHNPGGAQRTDRPLDVSIVDDGFFVVANGTDQMYTRAGNFYLDSAGSLVNQSGYKVLSSAGSPITIETNAYTNLSIDKGGNIKGMNSSGVVADLGTIGIAKFPNSQGLIKDGENLFRTTPNSGDPTIGLPGSGGFSSLRPGNLEMSNVDLSQEFTDMIIAQRGFQANSKVITTSNQLLEELAGIIR